MALRLPSALGRSEAGRLARPTLSRLAPASFPVLDTPQWRGRVAAMSEHQLELLRAGELFFTHVTSYGAQRVQLTPPAWLFDDDTPQVA